MRHENPSPSDALIGRRILGACGIAVPFVLALGMAIAGATWEGYSHQAQLISELGGAEAPYPAIQNFTFYVVGLLVLAFSVGLFRAIGSRIGAMLIGLFGIMTAMHPVFPCDAGCEFATTTGTLHNLQALVGFLAFVAGVSVIARSMKGRPEWAGYAAYTALTGPAALVLFLVWLVGVDALGLHGQIGTLQRTFVGTAVLWILVVGTRLARTADGRSRPEGGRSTGAG